MSKLVALSYVDELTRAFLIKKFKEYYSSNNLNLPLKFENREWAFVLIYNLPSFVMRRHISFKSFEDFKIFLLSNVPAHVYYSSAYYERPEIEKMEKKGWIKADLIFDIDADHIPSKSKSYKVVLNKAKRETLKLYKVLTSEFGVDEEKIKVYFSGSRGYHIHVYDENFQVLGSNERKEIVDYLTVNTEKVLDKGRFYNSSIALKTAKLLANYIKCLIRRKKLEDILKERKVRDLGRVYSILSNIDNLKRIEDGDLTFLPKSKALQYFIDELVEKILKSMRIYLDIPVTVDIKRLIRMPNSLHGKTGLRVVEVKIDEIESFEPFYDAVVFGDEKTKIRGLKRGCIEVMGEKYLIRAGERLSVPEYAAILFICRGLALYGH